MRFKKIKPEVRILAFDDGPFKSRSIGKTILVGVIFRGGLVMDGLLKREIKIDGLDAEKQIIDATKKMKHKDVRVIMLDGITFAGFNTVNIKNLNEKTGLPIIVVLRRKPNFKKFIAALKNLPHHEKRIECVEAAGKVYWTATAHKRLAFQVAGILQKDAAEIIRISCTHANFPEPLRVAHIIASGVVLGESVGRA